MQKKLSWEGYTNEDRNKIIEDMKNVIAEKGGCIINFNMFSDLALSLSIEIEENSISKLHQALAKILTISEFEPKSIRFASKKECLIFFNISFGSGKGKLKHKVPSVPG